MRKETTSESLEEQLKQRVKSTVETSPMVHAEGTAEGDIPLNALEVSEAARKHKPAKDHDEFSEERVADDLSYHDILKRD